MSEVEKPYQRLTYAHTRSFLSALATSRSSLWLGSDHVLCAQTSGYTQTYKRFYFRDIQAVVLRRTDGSKIATAILGGLGGMFALFVLMAASGGSWEAAGALGTIAALCLGAMGVNLALGPTCACYLRTAVQTEELMALNRLKRARRVLDRLRPLIAQAQGQLTPEETAARMQALAAAPAATPAAASFAAPLTAAPAASPAYVTDDPNLPPKMI